MEVKIELKIPGLEKLADVADKALGRFYFKKDIDNRAYEIIKLARAKAESIKLLSDTIRENSVDLEKVKLNENGLEIEAANLLNRTQSRILYQEAKKQLNLENIVSFAAEQLKNEPSVDSAPLDADWLSSFFAYAEDISSDRLQFIWGKILAGEIKQPSSFSLRTLQLVKTLSKEEGELIAKVGNFAFTLRSQKLLFRGGNFGLGKYGIQHTHITELATIGIIHAGENTIMPLHHFQNNTPLFYGNWYLLIRSSHQTEIPVYTFTKAGNELLKIMKQQADFHYFRDLAFFIKKNSGDIVYKDLSQPDIISGKPNPFLEFEFPSEDF